MEEWELKESWSEPFPFHSDDPTLVNASKAEEHEKFHIGGDCQTDISGNADIPRGLLLAAQSIGITSEPDPCLTKLGPFSPLTLRNPHLRTILRAISFCFIIDMQNI